MTRRAFVPVALAVLTLLSTFGVTAFAGDGPAAGDRQVVAYYFHGKVRCRTCVGMEGMTTAVLKTDFPAQLKDKSIDWRVVNYDEAANEHFIEDFKLVGPSVVLVETVGGRQVRYRNLDKIWQLAHEEDEFKQYVRVQITAFLKQR